MFYYRSFIYLDFYCTLKKKAINNRLGTPQQHEIYVCMTKIVRGLVQEKIGFKVDLFVKFCIIILSEKLITV